MRRSGALLIGILAGLFLGAAFVRRRTANAERADLYFEDGSMLSLSDGSPGAARLLPLARRIISQSRTTS
jgi:hypothetical protein